MDSKMKIANEEAKKVKIGTELVHPDGRKVIFVGSGEDDEGDYITVEHHMTKPGAINGPHFHPVLKESFEVKQGKMRFLVDGKETIVQAGEKITVQPNQVHQFWNISDELLIAVHEIRPPGLHWKMFALVHKLECEGKMTSKGIPKNPLWLGVAWEYIDGYMAGPPRFLQKVVLGSLAKLAKALGYRI
ncbi:cupin domain-containing protein [Bacillus horti]|uniref:Quercetin dioxygenase-like cupin family protein n=1 Tax=Caldalkalibacillus horti TaxID=77523 RepID=A0ABT9VX60_9BACI|nr:cupin domain-containing protein [Bacillus horti]MDQ0165580.1 quercetin dioxygenase-like cupin family protein [Bacillus horti]